MTDLPGSNLMRLRLKRQWVSGINALTYGTPRQFPSPGPSPLKRMGHHEGQRSLDVVRALGLDLADSSSLVVIDAASKQFAQFVYQRCRIQGQPVIGHHISNKDPSQCWALEKFARLIQLFKHHFKAFEHLIMINDMEVEEVLEQALAMLAKDQAQLKTAAT